MAYASVTRRHWNSDANDRRQPTSIELNERVAQAAEERGLDATPLFNLNGPLLTTPRPQEDIPLSVWDAAWNLVNRLQARARSELGREASDPPPKSQETLDGIIEELSRDTTGGKSKLKMPAETILDAIRIEPDEVTLRGDRSGVSMRLNELDKEHPAQEGRSSSRRTPSPLCEHVLTDWLQIHTDPHPV